MTAKLSGNQGGSLLSLVLACRDGDRAAQERLADRAAGQALRTAAMALGDVDAGRDVSQEVAVRMLRGVGRLRDPERFDAWVFRITVSEIRRALAGRRRRREVPVGLEHVEGHCNGSVDRSELLSASVELRSALADLSTRERTAIALRYVHDLDDAQIAAAMRCRPGTVRSLLTRGRARLRAHPALAALQPPPQVRGGPSVVSQIGDTS